ncbi:MAG TPA: SRPBCC domain-containing protein [Candidatus Avipropionibacterium avicola]|uniref:SRPBCC domain-containing protein n=1 Tax=Candidatus Avipropionibacterium avicola TaxID=2840701 RepID=A0A9D1KM17_9ACTN|nr:SRPBCC domain-containing protein [Candidatus Avipropionibacterium avicola]
MARIDVVTREIPSDPAAVHAAFTDPTALEVWLPPEGMTGRVTEYDLRPGGRCRMVLKYVDARQSPGKSTADEDVSVSRFIEIVPDHRVVQDIDFESDDPAFSGTMRLTWQVDPLNGGHASVVEMRAEHVPYGIDQSDHLAGMSSSLANLADHLAEHRSTTQS